MSTSTLKNRKKSKALNVHVRWMIRKDLSRILEIESKDDYSWGEEEFLSALRQRDNIEWIGTRNVSNTFDLLSTFGFWNPSTDICSYNPFILSTSEVPAVGPTLTLQDTVTFTNAAEPSDSITLRAPRLADRRATQVTRVYRTNLVGNIINYADPQWPYSELLTLEFEALTAAEADLFYAFLESTLGKLVTYLDYYGREWSGLIMTPNAEFYQVSRSDCTFGTSIQFDGQLS